jgi:hypothetical protein
VLVAAAEEEQLCRLQVELQLLQLEAEAAAPATTPGIGINNPAAAAAAAGAAPFFLSERAMEKLRSRKTKPATYNLDMNLIGETQQQQQQQQQTNAFAAFVSVFARSGCRQQLKTEALFHERRVLVSALPYAVLHSYVM